MPVKMQFPRPFVPDPPALWLKAGLRVSLSKGHTAQVQRYLLVIPAHVWEILPGCAENRAEMKLAFHGRR